MGGVGLAKGGVDPLVCTWGVGAGDEGTSLLLSPKPGPRQLELPGGPDHRWRIRFIKHGACSAAWRPRQTGKIRNALGGGAGVAGTNLIAPPAQVSEELGEKASYLYLPLGADFGHRRQRRETRGDKIFVFQIIGFLTLGAPIP